MLPVLINLQFVKIYTFGVFLVLAFFWASFLIWKLIRLTAFKEEEVFDGLFISLAGGLFFGRLIYVIFNFNDFGFSLLRFILINGYPGLSIYGILFGGFLSLFLYSTVKKIKITEMVDYFIPPLFLGLGFSKLGSFFSGVEVGTKTIFFLAVKYVGFDGYRHLTPLYESLLFFLAAYFTYLILFEIRKEKLTKGFNFFFFVWYFSLIYFLFDKLKEHGLYYAPLSLILLLTATVYFLYYFRSLILGKITMITNSFLIYGKKNYQKILSLTKKKTGRGKD